MKVLIADKFSEENIQRMKEQGFEIEYDEKLDGESLCKKIKESRCKILVVRSTKVQKEQIESGDDLELIIRAGSGYDTIDVDYASKRGIYVANCPGKNSVAVAELIMGLILSVDRKIPDNVISLRNKEWNKALFSKAQGLKGSTLGIIGYGNIGKEVVIRAQSFGIKCLILDFEKLFINGKNSNELLEFTSEMDYLLKNSDVVTVSVPSNEETNKMINKVFLEKMKKRSLLINTSRGSIVDEKEMVDHLEKNKEFWYAADVFMNEPSKSKDNFDSLLAQQPNCYGTHHIGASTQQSEQEIGDEAYRLIIEYSRTTQVHNCINLSKLTPTSNNTLILKIANTALPIIYQSLNNFSIIKQNMQSFQTLSTSILTLTFSLSPNQNITHAQDLLSPLQGVHSVNQI